jgi:hypothetical protein
MPKPVTRKLTLSDMMILVAMTGVSLSCYILLDNVLGGGQRFLFGLFEQTAGRWNSAMVVNRAAGVLALMLILFGGWTLALPIMLLRYPRPRWRRLNRQTGMSACVAAMAGMVICAAVASCGLILQLWVDGRAWLSPNSWNRFFDGLIVYAGISVAAVWGTQVLTGFWRPSRDWGDRLGRSLGCLWLVAGFVFSVRLLMG